MSERPAPVPEPSPAQERDDTLLALIGAAADPTLPAAIRDLLQDAADALQVSVLVAGAERHRYRALFDAVPDPVSVIAWDGTVLDLNRAGAEAYGRPAAEVVGQTIDVLNPDLPRDHLIPVRDALTAGRTHVVEVTNMRKDGTRFPVEVHSANFEFEGQPCVVAVARDLSGRAEAELRYRELMAVVDKGILVRDASGTVVYANAAALRMFDVDPEMGVAEAMRHERWKVIDEDGNELDEGEMPSLRALRLGKIESNKVLGFYNPALRKLSWLAVTSVPQFAPDSDRPHQVLSLFTDVTRLKRESALFERVQEIAHIGAWEWDAGRDALYLSDEARRMLGLSDPPGCMADAQEVFLPGDRKRLQAALERLARDEGAFDLELQGVRDDEPFWVRVIGQSEPGNPLARHFTGTMQDVTERKHAEEALRVQARTDPLTGMLDRDAILGEIADWLDDPSLSRFAVLYIDLDRFKVVNDVLGHAAGDELLVAVAQRIEAAVGADGLVARFGGDEFLVVCGAADDPGRPQRIAEAILHGFGDGFRIDNEDFAVTASIGIAHSPQDGGSVQALLQNADAAMYDSKRRVRNGWLAYNPALAESRKERLRVETHLRRAADNDEFHLVYQPQVELASGRIVGAEALIRWENPQLGPMPPDRFIAHAEITGDIVRIGAWVMREACRQARAWRDDGLGELRIAVNVSYRQLLGDDLVSMVEGLLGEFGLPGTALELEFTERVLIEDAPDTHRNFDRLRDIGVKLAIDDFGEGYSALNYLRRLPIHGLKLSQRFLQGVPGNQSDVAVCQAVSGIATSLGLGLIAEGVETEAQRRFLLKLGVEVGQGFLFAPGLRAPEFAEQLARATIVPVSA